MRLINVHDHALREFFGDRIPPYAILSHTWDDGEVTYQDWQSFNTASKKTGFQKITGACQLALEHEYDWLWVDTNCIDKTSSAELTEAINSMFQWYRKAERCYVYLADVDNSAYTIGDAELDRQLRRSRWFTRGWTLQELIAPNYLTFYAAGWAKLGSKDGVLSSVISAITGIDEAYLTASSDLTADSTGISRLSGASVARKMSWLAKRQTTRIEDMAYCMLGLFDINMPLLYGEGMKAFTRLQEEIIKVSTDHTIFCWHWNLSVPHDWVSLLAPSPQVFEGCGYFAKSNHMDELSIYSMTNAGLSIKLPVLRSQGIDFVALNARIPQDSLRSMGTAFIPIIAEKTKDTLYTVRSPFPPYPVVLRIEDTGVNELESLVVMTRIDPALSPVLWQRRRLLQEPKIVFQYGLILTFESLNLYDRSRDLKVWGASLKPELGMLVLQIDGNIGMGILEMEMIVRESLDLRRILVFFAVKLTAASPLWFCQIFATKSDPYFPPNMERYFQDLKPQILEAHFDQRAHHREDIDLSVIIGNPIRCMTGCHIRALHLRDGRPDYEPPREVVNKAVDYGVNRSGTKGTAINADDREVSDCDSVNAVFDGERPEERRVPRRGCLKIPRTRRS